MRCLLTRVCVLRGRASHNLAEGGCPREGDKPHHQVELGGISELGRAGRLHGGRPAGEPSWTRLRLPVGVRTVVGCAPAWDAVARCAVRRPHARHGTASPPGAAAAAEHARAMHGTAPPSDPEASRCEDAPLTGRTPAARGQPVPATRERVTRGMVIGPVGWGYTQQKDQPWLGGGATGVDGGGPVPCCATHEHTHTPNGNPPHAVAAARGGLRALVQCSQAARKPVDNCAALVPRAGAGCRLKVRPHLQALSYRRRPRTWDTRLPYAA